MTFPTNVPAVTIWAKDISGRAPTFVRHVYGPSYWQDCRGESTARDPDDNTFAAIPVTSLLDGYIPKKDDRILPAASDATSPPAGAMTITQVKDFRYGSAFMQHVEMTIK